MHAEASTRCMDCRRRRRSGLYGAVLCITCSCCSREEGGRSRNENLGSKKSCPQGCHADGLACLEDQQSEATVPHRARQREAEHAQCPGLLLHPAATAGKEVRPMRLQTLEASSPLPIALLGEAMHSLALCIRSALCWHIAQHPACSKAVWNQHIFTPGLRSSLMSAASTLNSTPHNLAPCTNYMHPSPGGIASRLSWPLNVYKPLPSTGPRHNCINRPRSDNSDPANISAQNAPHGAQAESPNALSGHDRDALTKAPRTSSLWQLQL